RLHLHLRHGGRAGRGQGRARGQAARPVRVRRHRRPRLRGDRDPQGRRSRDRDLRPLRGGGEGMDNLSATYDARGLVELDGTVPKISEIDGERAVLDARDLSTRKINAELRWLLYEEGIKEGTILS